MVAVTRSIDYSADHQPSLPEFLAATEAKYGKPAYRHDPQTSQQTYRIYYGWEGGRPMSLSDDQAQALANAAPRGEQSECIMGSRFLDAYQFAPDRTDTRPNCTASLVVEIARGNRDDLVRSTARPHPRSKRSFLQDEERGPARAPVFVSAPRLLLRRHLIGDLADDGPAHDRIGLTWFCAKVAGLCTSCA